MKVALGQFAVQPDWHDNLVICSDLIEQAALGGADFLLLPESILAQDMTDPDIIPKTAQPIDGPFITHLLAVTKRYPKLTMAGCLPIPDGLNRFYNTLLVIKNGQIIAEYRKLHLYDAFSFQESRSITAGNSLPPLVEVAGFKLGLMICYDLRFPELARRLVLEGADGLILPASWLKGPGKESHWDILVKARALENTCYMIATGECGARNIGNSMVVDPLGVAIVRAGEEPALIFATLEHSRIEHARSVLPVLHNRRFLPPKFI
ncbi:MAG: deaminated glutathione amidase [Zymomonas mobilis subsp. pomaceae]|uniref:Nitrilase/cyanide hydratase and apolipoprotein N-acyltransferase n=1 Tax=Zymomonas mobilis subsp. pomaceae (strain ATCC 29192 / DSM 22645 / JCM 10191 / CCUG 17912 / NBRC 13757 / NCIMB 11200 / NRRL B-4491 / Barker I) TaxID=579138 RepID=F8EWA9_ZYMMT|nr:deaminated glutathione amidase [Zymomonas mobilis]AEI38519.1 Nitrilase/cyanide hydratase and apolipoprotein N-acyltransferase [Zymomonas mobilis subsp. pomaceae ATCC 29192]MDX5948209.1 deaminated glutathione amidase [Zymomonas mobilis subsp. pomaceae]GEB88965.1 hydrolase [Zymomonas mobilis subsp. pomaceae]